jgi:hypothetical protein
MLLWLLYHRANIDSSFESVAKGALIADEAAQWCQLLAIVNHGNCEEAKEAQNLLGLALSGLLVSRSICARRFAMTDRQLNG